MKKLFASLVAVVVGVGLLASPSAFAKGQEKQSLVSIGDSITFGYNLGITNDHPSKEAFPYVMGADEGFRVRDLGVPGWTSSQLLNALQTDHAFQEAIRHADVITVDIGNNDLLQALQASNGNLTLLQGAIGSMVANLSQILTLLQQQSDAKIVVYNIYNAFQVNDPLNLHNLSNILLPTINGYIAGAVAAHTPYGKVTLADAYSAFGENQASDVRLGDVHPTVLGQEVLAQIGEMALKN